MIGALIHIVLDTAFVVVLAVIATIVFVIAWPFWYIRRRRARERCPEIALEVLNQRYALGEIGRKRISTEPRRYSRSASSVAKAQCAASSSAGNSRKPTSLPPMSP